jgi:protocatechuate 3,4-dioxygenase beta subunit
MPISPFNRRRLFGALGALGAAPFVTRGMHFPSAEAAPPPAVSCVLWPAMTEGPFFVDARLERSDLTSGTSRAGVVQGLPLTLTLDVARIRSAGCQPVSGARIDLWHTDAAGEYSDVGPGAGQPRTKGQAFLRGYQVSDANGRVRFRTIYPGWYPGRTIHIHLKARLFNAAGNTTYEFTSQLFFDDAINDIVMAMAPYNARGTRTVRNEGDVIYGNRTSALVTLRRPDDGARGYVGTAVLGLALA